MQDKLKPKYGFKTAISVVIGTVVGVGIYFKVNPVLKATGGSSEYAIISWIIAALIAVLGGLIISEIASMNNDTGGMQSLGEMTWGKSFGFILGWSQSIIYMPLLISIIAFYCSTFTLMFLGVKTHFIYLFFLTYFYLAFISIINLLSGVASGKFQQILTLLKLIPLIAIAVLGVVFSSPHGETNIFNNGLLENATHIGIFTALSSALIPILFAFEGWIFSTTISKEVRNPQKNIPYAIAFGLLSISVIYILFTIGLLNVFNGYEYAYSPNTANVFTAAIKLFGTTGGKLIQFFIIISALGVLNGLTLVAFRMPYGLSLKNNFPFSKYLSKVHHKNNMPINSGLFILIWTLILTSIGFIIYKLGNHSIFDIYGDIPIALFYIFYTLLFLGVLKLRYTHPDIDRPFKTPFLPMLVVLAVIGSLYAVYGEFLNYPYYMILSLAIALLGLGFYKFYKQNHSTT